MMRVLLFCLAAGTQTATAVPAFDSVLTMLQNLITQIETEEQSDQQDYNAFSAWFTQQQDTTSASIGMLETRLGELGATIANLASRQHNLQTEVNRLQGEIEAEQAQIDAASQKRTEEHDSFVKEQLDFDNSIAACKKAVELLAAHYGDGKPKESTRPAWMSLLSTLKTVQKLALVHKSPVASKLASFLQQPDHFNGAVQGGEHQDSTGEALSIVDQVRELADTFTEDKQSSIDQEAELTAAFTSLMEQKQALMAELVSQRDQQQSVLNQVNQELGENQNAEATAKATLQDETAYLTAIQTQEKDTTELYGQRQKDRALEKQAVSSAISVLSQAQPKALIQQNVKHQLVRKAGLKLKVNGCPQCHMASQMLLARSNALHSELLATAAMTTGSGDALAPVVTQLTDLISRIGEQQHAEQEHKDWCEKELSETAATKSHHETLVEEFKAKIEETEAIIAEKQQAIADTASSIEDADRDFAEVTDVRKKAKADYETELQDYKDATTALNQAIDILADFYRDGLKESLVQQPVSVPGASDKAAAPGMTTSSYDKKGGGRVVTVLKETRQDFETGMKSLEDQEAQQVTDFEAAKAAYQKTRADLVDAGNRFSAELQGAQLALAQAQTDLADNEAKVMAATTYLGQVGGSCNVLIENFDLRTKLRADEKEAIQKAVDILQAAVL